jgi:hypothetical protein
LESYINVHYIPPVIRETDPERLWLNLRPLSLNFWLKNRTAHFNLAQIME